MRLGCTRVLAGAIICTSVTFIGPLIPAANAGLLQLAGRFFGIGHLQPVVRRVTHSRKKAKKVVYYSPPPVLNQESAAPAEEGQIYSTSINRSVTVKKSLARKLRRATAGMALPVFHRQFRQENSIVTSDAVPLLSRVYYHPVDSKAVPAKNAVAANKHQLLSVPIKQPPLSSVPIKQPPLSSVPIKQPSLSSVPIKQPPLSSVPVKQSQLLSGPIKQPPLVLPRQLQSIDSRTADEERLQVSPESHSTNHDLAFSTRASWYGPGFHGRKTASGQIFNQYGLTAASRTLRLGSKVLVANPSTGRCCTVTINDRGPYVSGRDIDLSKGAAAKIGVTGVSPVVCVAYADDDAQTKSQHKQRGSSRPPKVTGKVMRLIADVDQ